MSLNVWSFTGRLGRDAEIKHLPSGSSVLEFSPAVDVGYGERKTTLWPRCSLFGDRGVKLAQYLTKGTQVAVSGEMSLREYQANDGSTKASMEVRVNAVDLIGSKRDDAPAVSRAAPAPFRSSPYKKPAFDEDDDIPF